MRASSLPLSRRQALAAFGTLALASRALLQAASQTRKAGFALQLYTLREPAKQDAAGTLKRAADMGWRYVQWSGMPQMPADKIRAALDAAGLKCIAAHVSIEAFETKFEQEVAFWKTVGALDVAPGGMMKDCTKDLAAWKRGCQRLDTLGARLRSVGMRLSFHNHQMEFEKFPEDARTKHEILMAETKPANLAAEIDIAWALAAGVDPVALIRKLKGRCPVVHAKDVLPSPDKKHKLVPLGQGAVKWADLFAAGRDAGIEWYVYEQDNGAGTPWDYTKASFDFLAKQKF
ncbi:MAG: sugar phosphate isomerase/epimerase [Verrucomicrobia bacterium]|nr:sugar phosphate isomerase/epimerase [Verrucomicrobiota bacterium]